MSFPGRVLIVGGRSGGISQRLEARGYTCEAVEQDDQLREAVAQVRPSAVVLASAPERAHHTLSLLRSMPALATVPVIVDGTGPDAASLEALDADAIARSAEELERQLEAGVRARRAVAREERGKLRLELLLDIYGAVATQTAPADVAKLLSDRLGALFDSDEVEVLLLSGEAPRRAFLVAPGEKTQVDLAVRPTLRRALESGSPVESDGSLIHPVPGEPDGLAALVVHRDAPLQREEKDLLDSVGVALNRAVAFGRTTAQAEERAATLETSYLERFKEVLDANRALQTADRKKDELLAVLTHDLRAPLNVLIGHSHLLLSDTSLTSSQRVSAEAMQRTTRKVLDLVEGLLERSRPRAHKPAFFTRTFDIAEVCQEVARELQILAQQRGVTLRAEAPISLMVVGDELKIRQALQNLVTNALKHAQRPKRVLVRALPERRPTGQVALVEVADDGVVADRAGLLLALEKGTGLGLSIAREAVEQHGGELKGEAPQEGGARFTFTLPLKAEEAAPVAVGTREVPMVLVVDDEPSIRRVCSVGLSGRYQVETANNGEEAVARAKELKPNVVLMDVFMPKKDGLAALRELKADEETKHIPVILFSAHAELPSRLPPGEMGAVAFLPKPFGIATLLNKVGEVLKRSANNDTRSSGTDPETGLFDHLGVLNRIELELGRHGRTHRPLAVAVLKPSRSPRGKLIPLASVVRQALQAPEVAGHLGGGVFAVVMPELPLDAAKALAEQLCERLSVEGHKYSARVTELAKAGEPAEAALEKLSR